jgi:pyruvate kinase
VKLLDNGMNIARVDLANGDLESNESYIEELNKALMMRATKTCAVMVDLTGPAIRTGKNKDNQVINISIGQSLKIVSDMTV